MGDCPNWRPIQGYSMAGCKANCTESRACDYKDMYWTADKFVLELPDGCVMRTQYERFQDFVDNDAKKYKDLRVTTNPSIDPVLQLWEDLADLSTSIPGSRRREIGRVDVSQLSIKELKALLRRRGCALLPGHKDEL